MEKLHGYIKREGDTWSYQLGGDLNRCKIGQGFETPQIAFKKMSLEKAKPNVELVPLVIHNDRLIDYKTFIEVIY